MVGLKDTKTYKRLNTCSVLNTDYGRIESSVVTPQKMPHCSLNTDYGRIESTNSYESAEYEWMLNTDYGRIERKVGGGLDV